MSPNETRRRREGGAALIVAVMMLAMMGLIGFASLDTVMRSRQVAGNTSQAQHALYAADAGVAASLQVLHNASFAAAPFPGSCLTATVPSATLSNGASYGPDPTAAVPGAICMAAWGDPCPGSDPSLGFRNSVWTIRTEGQAPGGAVARVQATGIRCLVP